MKVILQRSLASNVVVDNKIVGQIEKGLVLLVGFTHDDSQKDIDWMVEKVLNVRIFDDQNGVMNKSLLETGGQILSISQFTLYADCKKGRRPSYDLALGRSGAEPLYNSFNQKLREKNMQVETGVFGAEMRVHIANDGPITLILDSKG